MIIIINLNRLIRAVELELSLTDDNVLRHRCRTSLVAKE
jgi:hypothetical protein